MTYLRLALFLSAVASVAACSPPVVPADAGDSSVDVHDAAADVAVVPDTSDAGCVPPTDSGNLPPYLFGPCRADSDCPAGGTCLTQAASGYPAGFCSRTCTNNDACDPGQEGVYGVCRTVGTQQLCMRECLNGYSCEREGYTCTAVSATLNICTPSCDDSNCADCQTCNRWSNLCQPAPSTGAENGAACTASGMGSECRSGQCLVGQNMAGTYTGWSNGSCFSTCSLPVGYNVGNLWGPNRFPQSNCPSGSICFPNGDGFAERDPGICLDECATDADCRVAEGYFCRNQFQVGRNTNRRWMNGYCAPIECQGRACPSGLVCEVQSRVSGGQRVMVGVCRPPPPMPDAGADTGVDAAPDVAEDTSPTPDAETPDEGVDAGAAPDADDAGAPIDAALDGATD